MTEKVLMICEAKLSLEKQAGIIEARVTSWGPREGMDGRKFNYQPEGFMQWAESFSMENRPLPMFVNHAADAIPVGEWTSFEFDELGMTASGRLYTNTSQGSDLYKVMKESPSMFGGVSVGAYAETYQMVNADGEPDQGDEAYFQITQGGLREVSIVMYPNNPAAEVQKLEYFKPDGSADLRVLEDCLRDAGVSKQNAVTAASVFKKVLEQRDAVKAPIENAPIQRDSESDVTELLVALEERELLKQLSNRLKG
jgi:HK97 family phage prohead protease